MNIFDAIETRRTVKSFNKAPVEFDKISLIIEAATHAPSPGNLQNWKFIVVTDKDKIKSMPEHCYEQEWVAEAPVMIIVCGNLYTAIEYYGEEKGKAYTMQAMSAAIQNIILSATALELGSAWIGAFDKEKIKTTFSIPANTEPYAVIALGYSNYEPPEKIMQLIENQVFFNKYGRTIDNVNKVLKDYSVELKKIGDRTIEEISPAAKYLREKFKELKKNIKTILTLE
jgi:nitroreductase